MLVHLGSSVVLHSYVLIRCDFDETLVTEVDANALPSTWRMYPPPLDLAALGDAWVSGGASAVSRVPSAVTTSESNYLLNPRHPGFTQIRIGAPNPFSIDPRLVKP